MRAVRDAATPEAGLRAYEKERIRRTTLIVRRSPQLGRVALSAGQPRYFVTPNQHKIVRLSRR
jgi:hypothetical protein